MEDLEYGILDWSEEIDRIEEAMNHLKKAIEEIEDMPLVRQEVDDLKDTYNNLEKILDDINKAQEEYEKQRGDF